MAHVNRKEYWFIFTALAVLTALEVGIVYIPGVAKAALVSALIALAVVKAGLVGLFFMHLRYETAVLKATVIIPLMVPAFYAVVLIGEASWRLLP